MAEFLRLWSKQIAGILIILVGIWAGTLIGHYGTSDAIEFGGILTGGVLCIGGAALVQAGFDEKDKEES